MKKLLIKASAHVNEAMDFLDQTGDVESPELDQAYELLRQANQILKKESNNE